MDQPIKSGDNIIVRPGEVYEEYNMDMSGWRGLVVDIDEDDELLIAWDSQTLREMPDTVIAELLEEELDWTCMYVEPAAVLPYEARDTADDSLVIARARSAAHGVNFDEITSNPMFDDLIDEEWDDEWDEEWDEEDGLSFLERRQPFDLEVFLANMEIPAKEHASVRRAFSTGLGQYLFDASGSYQYGKQPTHLLAEYMSSPFVLGYGALAILDHKSIKPETKLKICQYVLFHLNPGSEEGLPYGMITLFGYLAQSGALVAPFFHLGMLAAEYGGVGLFRRSIWQFGTRREAVLPLLAWLAAVPDLPDSEKLWWVWRWSLESEFDPHLTKAIANFWLARPDVPAAMKQELCWAWLQEPKQVGTPPKAGQFMHALMSGDYAQAQQMLVEIGVEEADQLRLERMLPLIENDDRTLLSQMLREVHNLRLTPPPLKRIAIPTLARLGDDPTTVANMFWNSSRDFDTETVHGGIADLLREFQQQIDPAELRRLVERGLDHGRVGVRKSFHVLARELYGDVYLPRAQQDVAKSLRDWAAKQLRAGTKK